jgi:hypothetical protein
MIERSNNRALQALISFVRIDEEPLRQRRAMQITALVAAALFMENLDRTIIVTALPQVARSFDAGPVGLNIGATAYTAPRGLTAVSQISSDTAAATWLVCFCRGMAQPHECATPSIAAGASTARE